MRSVVSVPRLYNRPPGSHDRIGLLRQRLAASGRTAYDTATSVSRYMRSSYAHSFRHATPFRSLSRSISRHSLQVIRAFSGTNAVHASDERLLLDLDWKPKLSGTQEVIAWAVPITVCCLLYFFTAPAGISIPYGTCIGVLFGLLLVLVRSRFMEAMYKTREHIVTELGDPDSTFPTLENLLVHVKTKEGSNLAPLGVHCYHGFGSNTWSWSKVQQRLADKLGAVVTAHDMPGFGLTQRPTDLSAYLLSFNGRLGRLVLDHELAARGLLSHSDADSAGVTSYPQAHVSSTSSMESSTPPQATAAATAPAAQEEVGSAKEVAEKAQEQGLDSAVPAATAAVAKGDVTGVAKAGIDIIASAAGASSSSSTSAEPLAPTTTPEPTDAASFKSQQQQQQQEGMKRVLVGHSLGAVCAALEVIADPGKYSALVLVDPAIVAMGNGEAGAAALHLEELHDDSSFSRSLAGMEGGGVVSAAVDAAAEEAMEGAGLTSSSRSRSGSLDLEALAESTELQRADSMWSGSSSGRASDSGASEREEGAAAAVPSPPAAAEEGGGGSGSTTSSTTPTSGSRSNSKQQPQQLLAAGEPVSYYATKGKVGRGPAATTAAEDRGSLLFPLLERVQALLQAGFLMTMLMVISVLRPVILVILRAVVRNRKFWKSGLQQAYYDKSKVDDEMVNAYRLPQLVKGWEDGMLQFLVARLGAGGPAASATGGPLGGLEDTRLAQRLAAVVNANNMPVLIVHGQGDKMVPVQNSFRLAKMMKRGQVAVLKRSGHCPQEELPEAFSEVVGRFLSHVLKK